MPRTDYKLMEGWEFTLDADGKKGYRPVTLPHDWAISAPFCRDMDQGGLRVSGIVLESAGTAEAFGWRKKRKAIATIWMSAGFLKTAPYG